jgi:hypothetical protein
VLLKYGLTTAPDSKKAKAPRIIWIGSNGSTARLGWEFWLASALSLFGTTSTTRT